MIDRIYDGRLMIEDAEGREDRALGPGSKGVAFVDAAERDLFTRKPCVSGSDSASTVAPRSGEDRVRVDDRAARCEPNRANSARAWECLRVRNVDPSAVAG